ncbi:MAG: hypothetical protein LT071_04905 [Nocardioides sp.]|nr:hypothetical protein [Nocardioides sp.]
MLNWREIDLRGASLQGLDNTTHYGVNVLTWGQRSGQPYAALVHTAGGVTEAVPSWSGQVTSVMQDDMGDVVVIGGSPPRTHPYDDPAEWASPDPGDPFVAGWVQMGDEDPCNVAVTASGRIHGYEVAGESPTAGPTLAPGREPSALVVAGAEIGVVVAGPMADGPGVWRYANGQWDEVAAGEAPDAFTDALTASAPIVAGHRGGRPWLMSEEGALLAGPGVALDPQHPQVCLAHLEGYRAVEPLVLAVQAVEGIQLWLQHAAGWTMLPGPPGTLAAARLGHNEKWVAWVVADGRLWQADLSAIWDALG